MSDGPAETVGDVRYVVEAENWQYHVIKITRERIGSTTSYDEAHESARRLQQTHNVSTEGESARDRS